jgi:uncharacterized protein YacL
MNTSSPQILAMKRTLGLILVSLISSGLVVLAIEVFGLATVVAAVAVVLFVYLVYCFYQMEVSRQESMATLDKIERDLNQQ